MAGPHNLINEWETLQVFPPMPACKPSCRNQVSDAETHECPTCGFSTQHSWNPKKDNADGVRAITLSPLPPHIRHTDITRSYTVMLDKGCKELTLAKLLQEVNEHMRCHYL